MMLTYTMKNDCFLYQTDPMWAADRKYLLFRSSAERVLVGLPVTGEGRFMVLRGSRRVHGIALSVNSKKEQGFFKKQQVKNKKRPVVLCESRGHILKTSCRFWRRLDSFKNMPAYSMSCNVSNV